MAEIKAATDDTFEALVLNNDKPVVVDFWAAWCGPCKMVAPEMEKLAAKYDGVVDVVKVDVDANPRLSQAFGIMSIPTIAYFKPGEQPQGVVGFRPLEQLEQAFGLTRWPSPRPDPRPATRGHRQTDPGHDPGRRRSRGRRCVRRRAPESPGRADRATAIPGRLRALAARTADSMPGSDAAHCGRAPVGVRAARRMPSAPGGPPVRATGATPPRDRARNGRRPRA